MLYSLEMKTRLALYEAKMVDTHTYVLLGSKHSTYMTQIPNHFTSHFIGLKTKVSMKIPT